VYETTNVHPMDIEDKTVASGSIVPRREIAIKPRVSGILERVNVEPGQFVKKGDVIAKIKIVPNVVNLNSAESRVTSAEINLKNAEREFLRLKKLYEQQLLSVGEVNRAELEFELASQEFKASKDNLQLVKEGAVTGSGKISNVVTSTVQGMVTEVPVKEGGSVIESNTFNEGTTIASVADMGDLMFQGRVDESEVGKLKVGMPVSISIGALENQHFEGKLEYIAPKGMDREGTIEFEVRASLSLKPDSFIRANYSANADIILDRRDQVLALRESLVQFDKGKPFVEIETGPQIFTKRPVRLGLSDGVNVEVLEGLTPKDKVKSGDGSGEQKGGPGQQSQGWAQGRRGR
jgi:HlyD family secretion protein